MNGVDEGAALREQIASHERILVVVAGPNGAGKTTFVERFLQPLRLRIVNADAIALSLTPAASVPVAYEAARVAENIRRDLLTRNVSFCMETVFSDREGAKLAFLREAQVRGYVVLLVFIGLENSNLAMARVVERLAQGGHDVPDEKIVDRFPRTLHNLSEALTFVDHAYVFDNSSADEPYRFVANVHSSRIMRTGSFEPRWWVAARSQR